MHVLSRLCLWELLSVQHVVLSYASLLPVSLNSRDCITPATTIHLSDPPYENFFYSDCHSANQVVVTSPLPDSNLTIIGPRLLVAWPAGNSGVVTFFGPTNGINGSLSIRLVNGSATYPVRGVYQPASSSSSSKNPSVGAQALVSFNSSAILSVAILGSIRTIRDFTEGPSILVPSAQSAINVSLGEDGSVSLSRLWFDNITSTEITFKPYGNSCAVTNKDGALHFGAGTYNFTAIFDYPQLTQLNTSEVLRPDAHQLQTRSPDQATSLSFLSYSQKLLAGAWRFLTYFGRDSMISLLLMQPVLSEGDGGAIEAVIAAALERVNVTDNDGSVCHEETIGDYATYLNLQEGVYGSNATEPGCDYKMIDTDFFLPIALESYFVQTAVGRQRKTTFFRRESSFNTATYGTSYAEMAYLAAAKIMRISAPFAARGGQRRDNLIRLKQGQIVGEWRDSTYGIGGGRIPYDVNTALVPAALRSIAALSEAGFFPHHPQWKTIAARYAKVWEDETLRFFVVSIPASQARQLVTNYTRDANDGFPANAAQIVEDVVYHGLALDGNNNQSVVKVMNTDDCFRHFLLNTTNQAQLTLFLNQTAINIQAPFPVGLNTPVGMIVANPAYGGAPVYAANWTNNAYHGTVVWSWQLAMMAAGLQRQLGRCNSTVPTPDFCQDDVVYSNVKAAYNHLWDSIEANQQYLSSEVWSWVYRDNRFQYIALGALPPPAGNSPTESDIVQLWSLTFLSVRRDEKFR
ncbi:glycogen debranching enzyme [Polychaeton citri CBS 116435]|uniref:Glycogen debranching enzyme n=1 Tax=Polychaeton citri CBS 116435 TaxID=1314669 RepID=A0A9P4UP00_9PEZI|nr:glycogen debranching enzyme [Polychaeton citri CBS 116435]